MIEVVFFLFFWFCKFKKKCVYHSLKIALSAICAFGLNYMNKECLQKRIKYNYMVVLTGSVFYCNYYYVR